MRREGEGDCGMPTIMMCSGELVMLSYDNGKTYASSHTYAGQDPSELSAIGPSKRAAPTLRMRGSHLVLRLPSSGATLHRQDEDEASLSQYLYGCTCARLNGAAVGLAEL